MTARKRRNKGPRIVRRKKPTAAQRRHDMAVRRTDRAMAQMVASCCSQRTAVEMVRALPEDVRPKFGQVLGRYRVERGIPKRVMASRLLCHVRQVRAIEEDGLWNEGMVAAYLWYLSNEPKPQLRAAR